MLTYQRIETNGITLNCAMAGDGPLVLLVHGFPENAYSWRHQIEALSEAGYKVVAPDVRGYGSSDAPQPVEAYTFEEMTKDLAGLVPALGYDEAVIIGHDWGALLAWQSARLFPDVFRAVCGLSVPYSLPGEVSKTALYKKLFTDKGKFFYQIYFQDEGVAEAELEADIEDSLAKLFWAWSGDAYPNGWPLDKKHGDKVLTGITRPTLPLPWFTQDDLDAYTATFAQSGFRGPLNRYRVRDLDHDFLKAHPTNEIIQQPSLYIGGTHDPALMTYRIPPSELLPKVLADLRGCHMIEGVGHWTQQEAPKAVNRHILDWLGELD